MEFILRKVIKNVAFQVFFSMEMRHYIVLIKDQRRLIITRLIQGGVEILLLENPLTIESWISSVLMGYLACMQT